MNPIDVAQVMFDQGFRGNSGVTGLAVVGAETAGSFDETIVHVNVGGTKPGSRDRGLWAINDAWHPEVDDACAFDPVCSTEQAWRLSKQGTSYSAWNTFTNKSFERYLPIARVAWEAAKRIRVNKAMIASLQDDLAEADGHTSDLLQRLSTATTELTDTRTLLSNTEVAVETARAERDLLDAQVDRFDAWVDSIRKGS